MNSKRRILICLVAALLTTAGAQAESPAYYLFRAEALLSPAGAVVARFEVRSAGEVVSVDQAVLDFQGAGSRLIPIPAAPPIEGTRDWHLLVFANGLLVDDLDRATFASYQRVLQATHVREIAALDRLLGKPAGELKIDCGEPSPCGGGCLPSQDYDCDGVKNSLDNCTDDYNPDQANCDGDNTGNVCDGTNGIFQPYGDVQTCMTDKDAHVGYFEFEHHVEQRLGDVSSCGAPDRWTNWILSDAVCYNITDHSCCTNGLGTSIQSVGDSTTLWCGTNRNIDFCQ